MDILKQYEAALKFYKSRKYDEALKIIDELKTAAPNWKKSFLLEAFVRREQGEFIKEFAVLSKLLPRFDLKSPDEKNLSASALSMFGSVNRVLGNIAESVESFRLSAMMDGVGVKACTEMSNALFAANSSENFSAEDFRALYADYKKYSSDITPYPRRFYAHDKIRVGFVSSDFQWHVVMAWSWALLTELDKKFFAVNEIFPHVLPDKQFPLEKIQILFASRV